MDSANLSINFGTVIAINTDFVATSTVVPMRLDPFKVVIGLFTEVEVGIRQSITDKLVQLQSASN